MANGKAQSANQSQQNSTAKWQVLLSAIFGLSMVILDTTVVNVAFQTLRAEFGATLNDSQ